MFDLPTAKRLKRSDFFDNEPIEAQHDNIEEDVVAADKSIDDQIPSYGFEYDFITQQTIEPSANVQTPDIQAEAEEAFQFNLFKPASKPPIPTTNDTNQILEPQPALISLRSPSPQPTNIHFPTDRPPSYYFTASLSPATLSRLRARYAECAITPATLQARASTPWPGTHLPWRIISLPAYAKQVVVHDPGTSAGSSLKPVLEPENRKRTRPSKKRRDLLKVKAERRVRVIDETKSKEEHEREKRSKKNRERKLKRRAKERKEREEARAKGGDVEGNEDAQSSSGSDTD